MIDFNGTVILDSFGIPVLYIPYIPLMVVGK